MRETRVLITGANGFIGRNLEANLRLQPRLELLLFDLPQTVEDLGRLASKADFIFHLAGVNRPQNTDEYRSGNTELTRMLISFLEKENRKTPVVLSSSIQAELDNPYGRSKKEAEELVFGYAKKNSAPIYIYRFTNVFGKWCKPNYNSVVATFCHNAANNIPMRIDDPATELTLLYIDDLIKEFKRILAGEVKPQADTVMGVSTTYKVTLGNLADMINRFADSRVSITHDFDRNDLFIQKLYATYISYVDSEKLDIPADMKRDGRGYFAELIKSPHFGQISVSRTKPGITRGDHWHNTKAEKFIVIEGNAVIALRKIGFEDIIEYNVSGDEIRIIDIPSGYTHSIRNVGENDVLTVFWAGELFDPENPDTYFEKV